MTRNCPKCSSTPNQHTNHGFFTRKADGKQWRRFRCKKCRTTFSETTTQACYYQKKRHLNKRVSDLLCAGVSQRRIAKLLKISRTTVVRKFLFLARQARIKNNSQRESIPLIHDLQFDDLETFEHSKCKPLSVTMAVENGSRRIIGFQVSFMPCKGLLAEISRKKYGFREDERKVNRDKLFKTIAPFIAPHASVMSDKNPHYPPSVSKWFPTALHSVTKGRRGCVTGQGELKSGGYDPLFSLNHTFAMLRANINRLIRRTWCTTKLKERLADHIEIYVHYHNNTLINNKST